MNRKSQNLQHHLLLRESNLYPGIRHPVPLHFLFHEKNFYKSITPRLTVQNVDKPNGYFRKFSPNGKHLILFSHDQKSIDVYLYLGVGNVDGLLSQQNNECITAADTLFRSLRVRQQLFEKLFKHQFHIPIISFLCVTRHYLNREFSLFLDSGNFLLLASMAGGSIFPTYTAYQEYTDLFDDTELYDITFYVIDLKNGCISDTVKMEHDFVVLSHNHGVYVYEDIVAILSTYRQCVEIFLFDPVFGKLERTHILGPFSTIMDRDRVLGHLRDTNFVMDPNYSLPLSHLKQKILAHMYRELYFKPPFERHLHLKDFYKNFPLYERMIIFKMQLLDKHNLLIRFEKRQSLVQMELAGANLNDNFKLYVFYNLTLQVVLKVFQKDSLQLLRMLRNNSDSFRNGRPLFFPWYSSSPSTSNFFRKALERAILTFPGSLSDAAARFNPTVPISSQNFATSPYFDYSIFNYDESRITTLERPKLNSLEPVRFWDRETGLLKFRIFLEQPSEDWNHSFVLLRNPRDLVSYIFHPYEPLIISVQKLHSRYVVNFHLYSSNINTKELCSK